jgi:2-dehydropantoate 2-reductase
MKILVMGAGAVGAYFGARLEQAGEDVTFCARGERLDALKERGLRVRSLRDGELALKTRATDQPREFAPYDLILFCVKSYDTLKAGRRVAECLAPGGVVMTLQNGVENEAALCTVFPRAAVMAGNARVGAEMVAPGELVHTAAGTIEFGELDGRETNRAQRLAEVFRRAEIFGKLTTDLATIRWRKLMGNNATNPVCALGRCTLGRALEDPAAYALMRRLMLETAAVGRAEGARLADDRVDAHLAEIRAHPHADAIKPSTLQDLERGKRLEYDAICGAVLRAARRHEISVPATETVYALLKMLDDGARA